MQINKHILSVAIILVVLLSSCSVSRRASSRYETLSQRAQVSLIWNQQQYNMSSTVRIWRNELIVVSVQPMLGIEMVRMEANQDSVWIFDKMNRRYVALSYNEITNKLHTKISYKMLQDFMTKQAKGKAPLKWQLTTGKHELELSCSFSNREQNTLQAPKQTKTDRYKQVSLREILPL